MARFKLIKHNIIDNIFDDDLIYCSWPIYKVVKLNGKRLYSLKGFPTIHRCVSLYVAITEGDQAIS